MNTRDGSGAGFGGRTGIDDDWIDGPGSGGSGRSGGAATGMVGGVTSEDCARATTTIPNSTVSATTMVTNSDPLRRLNILGPILRNHEHHASACAQHCTIDYRTARDRSVKC